MLSNLSNHSDGDFGPDDEDLFFAEFSLTFSTIISATMVFIIVASIAGNLLVFLAFYANASLRIPSNYFFLSLAASDLINASFVMPLELDSFMKKWRWDHGEFMCDLWTTFYLISAPASIINLSAVAFDRFICISRPLRYHSIMTPVRAVTLIALIWLYSMLTAVIPQMGWKPSESSMFEGVCEFNLTMEYNVMISVLNFVIPPLVMTVLYLKIYKIARRHARRIGAMETSLSHTASARDGTDREETNQRTTVKRNIKASKTLLVIIATFYLCWFPYTLTSIVMNLCVDCPMIAVEVNICLLLLGYLNSALNPILYGFHDKAFKDTYKKIVNALFA